MTCYFPGGARAEGYAPCGSGSDLCCPPGTACDINGVCLGHGSNGARLVMRGACKDDEEGGCVDYCENQVLNSPAFLISCLSPPSFCCSSDPAEECCAGGTFSLEGMGLSVTQEGVEAEHDDEDSDDEGDGGGYSPGRPTYTKLPDGGGPVATATLETTTTVTDPVVIGTRTAEQAEKGDPENNSATLVAIGVGLGVGGAALIVLLVAIVWWHLRRKRKRQAEGDDADVLAVKTGGWSRSSISDVAEGGGSTRRERTGLVGAPTATTVTTDTSTGFAGNERAQTLLSYPHNGGSQAYNQVHGEGANPGVAMTMATRGISPTSMAMSPAPPYEPPEYDRGEYGHDFLVVDGPTPTQHGNAGVGDDGKPRLGE